jgi:15-hydroxyprostaglandin dehydrogenase (NAD)
MAARSPHPELSLLLELATGKFGNNIFFKSISHHTMAVKQRAALVTGGGAGIGYALTEHLLQKGYRVAIIDIDGTRASAAQKTLGNDVLGLQCDVSSWESSTTAFKKAFEWADGSIDFFAANAGVAEKQSLYTLPDDEEPQKPNLATIEVDLLGVFYGLKLYRHYARKSGTGRGGKVVITSSMAGNYPMFVAPIYCAAKHGVSLMDNECAFCNSY